MDSAPSALNGYLRSSAKHTDPSRSARQIIWSRLHGNVRARVQIVTLRMVIAFAKRFGWPLDQLDVVTAFLYDVMKEQAEGVKMDGESTAWN